MPSKSKTKHRSFFLTPIDPFDARKGFTRCDPAGVGMHVGSGRQHVAGDSNFWRDQKGRLVVRLSCRGYVHQCYVTTKLRMMVTDDMLWDFHEYMMETLFQWISGGYEETPEVFFDSPFKWETARSRNKGSRK